MSSCCSIIKYSSSREVSDKYFIGSTIHLKPLEHSIHTKNEKKEKRNNKRISKKYSKQFIQQRVQIILTVL